jgi:hypothetical protein
MDQRIGLAAVDLTANPADIDVDDIGHRIKMQIPDMLQKHRMGNHLVYIAGEVFEQLKLPGHQLDFAAAPSGDTRQQIDFQIADAQHRFLDQGRAAAGEGVDPRQHLA